MERKKSSLVIISAPSGCGKDTIVHRVRKIMPDVGLSISCTTRAPRPKQEGGMEKHGVDYFFLSERQFLDGIYSRDFLEYANVKSDWYGTPRSYIAKLPEMKNKPCIRYALRI